MTLAFILTMPGCGSWNGKWSGEGKLYAITKKMSDAEGSRFAGRSWSYGWPDGWRARVECRAVFGIELRKLRAASEGFCGYEWMVDSILARDCIKADHELKEEVAQ